MQLQIIPFKTQSAIYKNGLIFRADYLKSFLPDFTFHMFGTISIEELWNGTFPSIFWRNIHSPQFVSVN